MQTNGFNLSTVWPTSTTTLYYIGCSQDSESFSSPAREPRALNRPVAHPLQTTKNDGLSYGRLRLEGNAGGELDLARGPVGGLKRLRAVRGIQVDAALNIERVEGIHVHSQLDPLGKLKDLIQRNVGVVV